MDTAYTTTRYAAVYVTRHHKGAMNYNGIGAGISFDVYLIMLVHTRRVLCVHHTPALLRS